MEQTKVTKIAAFTKDGLGGNSAGLVWPASGISSGERQEIASAVGYSETAFVERSANSDLRIEYFTPNRQIDICGHATVAAFSYLRDSGEVSLGQHSFDSVLGKHKVEVRDKTVGLWQKQLESKELTDPIIGQMVLESLNLKESDIAFPFRVASNGSAFLLIEVKNLISLKNISPNQEEILKLSEKLELVGYYIYFRQNEKEIDARMFAPAYGIPEESATGMAAGALALSLHSQTRGRGFLIRQGHLMPKPSPALLYAEIFADQTVLISGEAQTALSIDALTSS